MPFTLVHAGKYRRQVKNTDNTATKHNPEKQTAQNTAKQNYSGLVASYDTRPGNEVGLFYNVPKTTLGWEDQLTADLKRLYQTRKRR